MPEPDYGFLVLGFNKMYAGVDLNEYEVTYQHVFFLKKEKNILILNLH